MSIHAKEYVKAFIEGHIAPKDFMSALERGPRVYDWLQFIVPQGKIFHKCLIHVNEMGENSFTIEGVPYDIRVAVDHLKTLCHGHPWCTYYYVHLEIVDLWRAAFPQETIEAGDSIKERFFFELDVVPRYIGGRDVYACGILDDIIESIPKALSRDERVAMGQRLVSEAFPVEGNKHPYWRQEADWQMGVNQKPMRFLYQKQEGNRYEYYFEDVLTREQRMVCQVSVG